MVALKMKILLLEDDELIAEQVCEYFTRKNHQITHYLNGESLLDSNKILEVDICIFDINVPKMNGFETLSTLRELNIHKPTIFLTAMSDIEHIRLAYQLGCEDFVKKPFHFEELEIRMHKLINNCTHDINITDEIAFNFIKTTLYIKEREVSLSEIERKLLYLLAKHRNHYILSSAIVEYVWEDISIDMNTLRTTIKRLRSKIGRMSILSSRTFGYKLVAHD